MEPSIAEPLPQDHDALVDVLDERAEVFVLQGKTVAEIWIHGDLQVGHGPDREAALGALAEACRR